MRYSRLAIPGVLLLPLAALAFQQPAVWHDDLVDHLTGTWKMQGQVMGKDAHHTVSADWVLHHQFLRIHEETTPDAPKDEHRYEAFWFLGYDTDSKKYVMHLMDVFGGKYSETLGYGTREGNQIRFLFDYPDGPFRNIFLWDPDKNMWEWLMEQKDKSGKWAPFADLKLTKQ